MFLLTKYRIIATIFQEMLVWAPADNFP